MRDSLASYVEESLATNKDLAELILEEDAKYQGCDKACLLASVDKLYQAMKESNAQYDGRLSPSGLVGNDGLKMEAFQGGLFSDFVHRVMARALRVSECNACMKRIVAAPTAGACGVLPAVLISLQERENLSDEQMVKALIVAGGIGGVIAQRASISGARGGCQAEVGSASAMAAGAIVYLLGGSADMVASASAIALKGLLGLACDPVAGLVEVPCVKRNVMGAMQAMSAAEMTMAGIRSQIPADEVFDAMASISQTMSDTIRETAKGGLAMTPTGLRIKLKMFGQ